jgi:hypothetical protein
MINNLEHSDNGGKWIRRVFAAHNNQLVLHDHTGGIVLTNNALTSAQIGGDVEFKANVALASDDGTSLIRMVAHIGGTRISVIEHLFVPNGEPVQKKAIILQVSSQSTVSEHSTASDLVVWLSMKNRAAYKQVDKWLPEFMSLTFNDAQELVKAGLREKVSSACEARYPHLLDVILPRTIENRLALRLLCEAWLMTDGKKEMPHGDIVIHAPVSPDDWFEPFVEGFKTLQKADDKLKTARENCARIANLMGDSSRDLAKNFFENLAKLYENGVTEVTPDKFKGDIEGLVKNLKSAATA